MSLHVVAAIDESDAGAQAVRTAVEIAKRSSGKVTALHVVAAPARTGLRTIVAAGVAELEDTSSEDRVRLQLEHDSSAPLQLSVAYGIPSIEICRFAEEGHADLIVVGRKEHCERSRLLLGDTADAVARRSRIPTLFVPLTGSRLAKVLLALDGSERGMRVLEQACTFVRAIGASLHVITVESAMRGSGPSVLPLTRSAGIQARVQEATAREDLADARVTIRCGNVTDEVLKEIEAGGHDVLVIGHHRGGPGWLVQTGSTAQQLGHAAPCAVLTIPL